MASFDSFYVGVFQLVQIYKIWKVNSASEYIRVH